MACSSWARTGAGSTESAASACTAATSSRAAKVAWKARAYSAASCSPAVASSSIGTQRCTPRYHRRLPAMRVPAGSIAALRPSGLPPATRGRAVHRSGWATSARPCPGPQGSVDLGRGSIGWQ
jgi:hypothetical protein